MPIKIFFEILKKAYLTNLEKIILQNLSQTDIDHFTEDFKQCIWVIEEINDTLPNYFRTENKYTKDKYRHTIANHLEEIRDRDGYRLFLQMFNIEAFNRDNEKVIPTCIELINFLKPNSSAKLPWEVKVHIKYQDDVEEIYKKEPLKENKYLVNDLRQYKFALVNNSLHEKIINQMASTDKNPRRNEVFNLYIQTLLAQKMNASFKVFSFEKGESKEVQPDKFLQETENLFIDYYENIKSDLNSGEYGPPKSNTNWNNFLQSLYDLKNEMIKLKENNIRALLKFSAEEIDELMFDIRGFLKANNLDELRWPKVKELTAYEGSAGLLKKINQAGGMKAVGKLYKEKIGPIIENENKLNQNFNLENELETLHRQVTETKSLNEIEAIKAIDKIQEERIERLIKARKELIEEFKKNKFWG